MRVPKILACLAAVTMAAARLAADFQIRDGDRVVFLGDSITEQRLYTTYIEAYALTRHPNWNLTFRNVGWGGDTAWLRQRAHPDEGQLFKAEGEELSTKVTDAVGRGLGRDVLPFKPTFVTVKFGMNDHSYQKFRPDIFRAYARSQTEIATVLKRAGARVTFLTPQPIEERRPDPDIDDRNQSLRKFSDGLRGVAENTGAGFVDQFNPFMKLMLDARAENPKAFIGGGDAVHPGPSGQTLMAWAVLKGMGATPLVSVAQIDASAQTAKTEACTISAVKMADGVLSFDRLDTSLPMPIDPRAEAALKLAPVLAELSRLELRVTGLTAATYDVLIDGESVGKVTSKELSEGWNFSNAGGPITRQAREVLAGVFAKNEVFFNRWRNVQLFNLPGWARGADIESQRNAEVARLDAQIAEQETKLNALRKPKVHRFELKPLQP
jgi:lysophospholipase L1-like esterase